MPLLRVLVAAVGGAVLLGASTPARAMAAAPVDFAAIRSTKRVAALLIAEPILIDGRLDEPAWGQAVPATDFLQQQPVEGAATTEPSEVRFLYDRDTLYAGGTFYDSDPRGGITNELKRDFSARDGDLITLVLDTFHDQRNSFNFMINPAGAQRDSQSYDDGRQNNPDWDGVWHVKTGKFDGGWTMEMSIPFKTLRFAEGDAHVWGVNVFRLIRRKNEITLWSPVPRQFTQFKVSYAGTLEGIDGIHPGRNLRIKPFMTSGVSRLASGHNDWHRDAGVDVKYGVGSALTLDLTYRTDFSQVEVDAQQVNLTRFALFLPEKRDFFLENQGAFRIGDIDQLTGARSPVIPFFSRRIGLDPEGNLVPITGGARVSGRAGAYTIGLLNMESESTATLARENLSAMRIGRNIGVGSSVSGFYLGRESSGAGGDNRVAGGDLHLNVRRTIDVDGFLMASAAPDRRGTAGRAAFSVNENLYKLYAAYTNVTPTFRNDLGFIPRSDIGLFSWEAERNVRPKAMGRWARNFAVGTEGDVYDNSRHDALVSRLSRFDASADFADGGRFVATFDWDFEHLGTPFEISRGVTLPAGGYHFRQASQSYTSDASRPVSGSVKLTAGDFYSGTLRGVDTSVRIRANERFAAAVSYSHNDVTLREGSFTRDLVGIRADHSFTTHMWLNTFIQYNQASGSWLTNIRYRYMYRPLSDIFVVVNETRTAGRPPERAVILKYTLLMAF